MSPDILKCVLETSWRLKAQGIYWGLAIQVSYAWHAHNTRLLERQQSVGVIIWYEQFRYKEHLPDGQEYSKTEVFRANIANKPFS